MRGVVTIATHDPAYAVMADNLVASLRGAGQYEGPIVVLSDLPEAAFGEKTRSSASFVVVKHGMHNQYSSRWAKTRLDLLTPFDTTLFLDADITTMAPIAEIWGHAAVGDIHMAKDPANWPRGLRSPYPPPGIYYNSGVILWNRGQEATRLFSAWREAWEKTRTTDQGALYLAQISSLVIPKEMPAKFNQKRVLSDAVFWHPMGTQNEFKPKNASKPKKRYC